MTIRYTNKLSLVCYSFNNIARKTNNSFEEAIAGILWRNDANNVASFQNRLHRWNTEQVRYGTYYEHEVSFRARINQRLHTLFPLIEPHLVILFESNLKSLFFTLVLPLSRNSKSCHTSSNKQLRT